MCFYLSSPGGLSPQARDSEGMRKGKTHRSRYNETRINQSSLTALVQNFVYVLGTAWGRI